MRISDWSSDVCSSDLSISSEDSALRFSGRFKVNVQQCSWRSVMRGSVISLLRNACILEFGEHFFVMLTEFGRTAHDTRGTGIKTYRRNKRAGVRTIGKLQVPHPFHVIHLRVDQNV